jgi:energy-coupling factor transport system permease protein
MQGVAIPISMVPGDSFLHKMNPLPKLVMAVGMLAFSFSTRNPAVLGAAFAVGLGMITVAQVWGGFMRVFRIIIPISLSLIVLQSIAPAFPRPWTPITSILTVTIYQEGIYSGISLLTRIYAMTTFALILVLTTHPSDLFTSMQKIGMPYVLNFILTMTLQLIPILQREFGVVLSAQKSRGMKGTGFGSLLPSMVPVFVGAVERVQQLSISLESRAFGSKGHKTSYREVTLKLKDYIALVIAIIGSVALTTWVIIDKSLDWSQTMVFPDVVSVTLVAVAFVGFVTFVMIAIYYVINV